MFRAKTGTILLALTAICLVAVIGCDEDDENTLDVERTASSYRSEGWELFGQGRIDDAIIPFNMAVTREPQDPRAYNGLGWCWANKGVLESGRENFEKAILFGLETADPHAGLAICLRDLQPLDHTGVIESCRTALDISPEYRMSHDSSIDWRDLRLVLAQIRFDLGEYDEVNVQIGLMGGNQVAVPAEAGPDRQAALSALALEIQALGELYAE